MTEDQIKHMVSRFLGWKLPENFNPDGGVSFQRTFNDHLPTPSKHEPSGTNLFDARQAEEMVRYMIAGPAESVVGEVINQERCTIHGPIARYSDKCGECEAQGLTGPTHPRRNCGGLTMSVTPPIWSWV